MRNPALLTTTAVRSLVAATFALTLAGPAWAQADPTAPPDSPVEPAPAATDETQEPSSTAPSIQDAQADASDIVVTGSRIRRPNLESQIPVTSIAGTEFFETGQVSIGEALGALAEERNSNLASVTD